METRLVVPAYAKLNLALDVIGRRPDGYHEVEMIMENIDLYDLVTMQSQNGGELTVCCNHPEVPPGEGNLAFRAAQLMKEHYGVQKGVAITIDKRIPVAAGLAGGSTDAAAVIKGLNQLWDLKRPVGELMALGKELGADIPYCIHGGTCLAQGIGERITQLVSGQCHWVVLANPPGGLNTGAVYNGLALDRLENRPNIAGLIRALENGAITDFAPHLGNVLQSVSMGMMPIIGQLLGKFGELGSPATLMTGSGPTVFGLVNSKEKALKVAEGLEEAFPEVTVFVTKNIVSHKSGKISAEM